MTGGVAVPVGTPWFEPSRARLEDVARRMLARKRSRDKRAAEMTSRFLLILGMAFTAAAQSGTRPIDRQARAFGPASQPGYRGELETGVSYVPESGLRLGSKDMGDVDTLHNRLRYTGTFVTGGDVNWSTGLAFERYGFGFSQGTALPAAVGSFSIPLGVNWRLAPKWTLLGEVSPGIYSDFQDLNGSDFNAPLLGGVSYAVNENLLLFLQVSVDARRDIPVVGGPGLRWQMTPQWTLSLLLPRPRVEFRPTTNWMVYAGGELAGGAYQLGENHGVEHGDPRLNNVNMTYREIRAGVGALWTLNAHWRMEAGAGWVIDRRFVVDEYRLTWNGEGAPYARIQFSYRY